MKASSVVWRASGERLKWLSLGHPKSTIDAFRRLHCRAQSVETSVLEQSSSSCGAARTFKHSFLQLQHQVAPSHSEPNSPGSRFAAAGGRGIHGLSKLPNPSLPEDCRAPLTSKVSGPNNRQEGAPQEDSRSIGSAESPSTGSTRRRSWWSYITLPCGAVAILGTGYVAYWFYQSGFDPRITQLQLAVHRDQLMCYLRYDGLVRKEAWENAAFETGLSDDWRRLLVVYFLQLDLDKENGVKRADILTLLNQAGVEKPMNLKTVRAFVDRGRGRSPGEKLMSGCSIQEFTALIEGLLLQTTVSSFHSNNESTESTESFSTPDLPAAVVDGLKGKLEEYLASAVPGTTQYVAIQPMSSSASGTSLLESSSATEDLRILEIDLQQAIRMRSTYLELQSRKKLSEAQSRRLETLQLRINSLTSAICETEARRSLEQRQSTLAAAISNK